MRVERKEPTIVTAARLGLGLGMLIGSALLVPKSAAGQEDAPPEPPPRTAVRELRAATTLRVLDDRGAEVPPPRRTWPTGVYQAVVLAPRDVELPEELSEIVDHGPISRTGDFPFETIQDNYWSGARRNEVYYLPRAFRLARNPSGYGLSAVWTNDQKVLLTVNLRAAVDSAELAYAETSIRRREGQAVRLLPMPYQGADLVDLEIMEGWQIDRIQAPSFASLTGDLPLVFEMSAASFANLKPLLETEGLGAAMVVHSGDRSFEVDVKISLRDPSGRAYSPLADVRVGYDAARATLVLDGVANYLDFPVAVDAVDIVLEGDDWSGAEVYSGLRPQEPVVLDPGARGAIAVALPATSALAGAAAPADERRRSGGRSLGETLLRDLIGGLLEGEGVSIREHERDDEESATPLFAPRPLDGVARRYRLRLIPDYGCQSCYDRIWGGLEVVSYIERLRQLRVEVLASAFDAAYQGHQLDSVTIDLRSRHFSPKADAGRGLHSVSLAPDRPLDESIAVFLPSANEPLGLDYRVTARLSDGRVWRADGWTETEDSLHLLIGAAEIRGLAGE